MTNPEVHGGRYGTVDGIGSVRQWSISDQQNNPMVRNSATAAGTARAKGNSSWNGGYNVHGARPQILPSERFAFLGFTAPDTDVGGTVGQAYGGNAIMDSVTLVWDWATGGVIQQSNTFSGHLALTSSPAHAAVPDATVSDPEEVIGTKISYSPDGTAWTDLKNLTQAQLAFSAANETYANSSTAGATGRNPGPIDWAASISMESNLLGSGLVKGTSYQFRFYVNATQYYLLKWGKVKEFTGLQTDPESGAIIAHSITIEMDATQAGVLGTITLPVVGTDPAVEWWPF